MKKDKLLTIDNLLSWDDVMQLGAPIGSSSVFAGRRYLIDCTSFNYQKELFEKAFQDIIIKPFKEKFSDIMMNAEKYDIRFYNHLNEDGKWSYKISIAHVMVALLKDYDVNDNNIEFYKDLCKKLITLPKDQVLFICDTLLAKQKLTINEAISHFDEYVHHGYDKNYLLDIRKMVINKRKHLEEIYDYFDRDFPVEILEHINKDSLLLFFNSVIFSNPHIVNFYIGKIKYSELIEHVPVSELSAIVNTLNNYRLITEYISDENDKNYDHSLTYNCNSGKETLKALESKISYGRLIHLLCKFDDYDKMDGYYTSYEELLASKASKTWKKIQDTKLVESIKVNFEMITSGRNYNVAPVRSHVIVNPNSEKRQADLKKRYDKLEEKLNFYATKKPVVELRGINNFVGYFAHFYQNGTVVLDKYYEYGRDRRGNEKIVPVRSDAIYVMNNREFASLCRYTKRELMEEKKYNNQDVDRIPHSGNWTEKVDKVINGPGYGELDLEFLNMLIKALGVDEGYQKIK